MNRRVEISRIERRSAFFVHGLEEGTRKGLEEGRREGYAQLVLSMLEYRGLSCSQQQKSQILAATLGQLERWSVLVREVDHTEALLAR
ncbi:MAG: hypothetical protein KC457_00380 [Myxococcales bacterium]|nr:hypothetical protein [Myxococcales bacterium]